MNKLSEPPDGLILTISKEMLKEKGIKNWLSSLFEAMKNEKMTYWFKLGAKPKFDVLYVYLCISNKIRYRITFVKTEGAKEIHFTGSGVTIFARAWLVTCGPLIKAPENIYYKGFRGFKYCMKFFDNF